MALNHYYSSQYYASNFHVSNYYRPTAEVAGGGGGGTVPWSRRSTRVDPLLAAYKDQKDLMELYHLLKMSDMF